MAKLLEVRNLTTRFRTERGAVMAVDDVSFEVDAGETLAIVGESGCGKSVPAMSILRLIPEPPGKIAGAIRLNGKNLLECSDREMRAIRGNDISMIFQEPMTSLNPCFTVGFQIGESLITTRGLHRAACLHLPNDLLAAVCSLAHERRFMAFPYPLPGGLSPQG